MYAVIFTARLADIDGDYSAMAAQLRELALAEFDCREFRASCEDGQEIAVSLWDSLEQIRAWKAHPLHARAQALGRERWYKSYNVKVVEILREYSHPD